MSSNHTPNYHLSQWEPEDKVVRTDFNADNARIDAAIKAEADARVSAVSALSQTVAGHTATLNKKGNCRIEIRSYTGTGQNGDGAYVSIPFPAKPVAFIIIGPRCTLTVDCTSGRNAFAGYVYHSGYGSSFNGSATTITWSGNTARLEIFQGIQDLNLSDTTYSVIAFLAVDQ